MSNFIFYQFFLIKIGIYFKVTKFILQLFDMPNLLVFNYKICPIFCPIFSHRRITSWTRTASAAIGVAEEFAIARRPRHLASRVAEQHPEGLADSPNWWWWWWWWCRWRCRWRCSGRRKRHRRRVSILLPEGHQNMDIKSKYSHKIWARKSKIWA